MFHVVNNATIRTINTRIDDPLMKPIDGFPINGGIDEHLWFINGRIDAPKGINTEDFRCTVN